MTLICITMGIACGFFIACMAVEVIAACNLY